MCDILSNSLTSTSYIQVQNTLIILNRLLDLFPQVKHLGRRIFDCLNEIKVKFADEDEDGKKIFNSLLLMTENYSKKLQKKIEKELDSFDVKKLKLDVRDEKYNRDKKR